MTRRRSILELAILQLEEATGEVVRGFAGLPCAERSAIKMVRWQRIRYITLIMYVRWQLYRSQALNRRHRERNNAHAQLKAVLIESLRVDGKPRQNHIAFLGSTSIDGRDRPRFWCEVTEQLDQLHNRLTRQDRMRILASITRRLGEPPPTQAQIEAFRRDRDELRKRWAQE